MSDKNQKKGAAKDLSTSLSLAFREKGVHLKEAAGKIGVSYTAIKQDLSRNRFHPDDLEPLLSLAGMPFQGIAALHAIYHFEEKKRLHGGRRIGRSLSEKIAQGAGTLDDVFVELDERTKNALHYIESGREVIPKFFATMGEGCLLIVFIADQIPSHWTTRTGASWIPPILEAINAGAKIAYFHPSPKIVESLVDLGVRSILPEKDIREELASFKQRLARAAQLARLPNSDLDGQLLLVPHDFPFMCLPNHRIVCYIFRGNSGSRVFATGTYPIRNPLGNDRLSEDNAVMPLNNEFTEFVEKIVERTLQKQVASISDPVEKSRMASLLDACYGLQL